MTIPVISILRTKYPKIKITVLTTKFFSVLFNQIPNINFVYFQPKHKTIAGLFKLSREIKKIKPDQIIDLHDVLRTKILRFFLMDKIGNTHVLNKGRKEKLSLIKGSSLTQLKSMHQRYSDVFSSLNINVDLDDFVHYNKINIDKNKYGFTSSDKLIGIAPFAGHSCKEYSIKNILSLLDLLDKTYQILIFGAPGKEEKKIIQLCNNKSNRHVISSKYLLEEQMAIISNLDVMISMDSANGHIASLFGINVITIWGATHPYTGYSAFRQPNKNAIIPDLVDFPNLPVTIYGSKCPPNYLEAINSIRPEKILERLDQII